MNYSPLRYPGGKNNISVLVELLMQKAGIRRGIYIEPFVGGGGVALSLLLKDKVESIVINDYDIAIYSVWYAILNETEKFVEMIDQAVLSIEEWKKQKTIYNQYHDSYSLELAFATFYLNRTNRSGIIKAGPIGGYNQTGKYLLSARFNKEKLKKKIEKIATYANRIQLYNLEIKDFIKVILPKYEKNSFIYFDPPYYTKGKKLYINFFEADDHVELSKLILGIRSKWMLTYDDVPEIELLYSKKQIKRFDITYSVANSGKKSEILVLSKPFWPTSEELQAINFNLR